jgi:DNA-binding LacI/PurR family transcriptional regulator
MAAAMTLHGLEEGPRDPTPAYYQIQRRIVDDYFRSLKTGDKLPTERELCEEYAVSRTTMRQALSILVREGYIERYKARGTFLVRKPDFLKRQTDKEQIPIITIAFPELHPSGVMATAVSLLESRAFKNGFLLHVMNLSHNLDVLHSHLEHVLHNEAITGVVYFPIVESMESRDKNQAILRLFREMRLPFVVVDHPARSYDQVRSLLRRGGDIDHDKQLFTSLDFDFVVPDHLYGGYLATRHLLELGHRKIAFVGKEPSYPTYLREQGMHRAVRELDDGTTHVESLMVPDLLTNPDAGIQTVKRLCERGVTAVFAVHDFVGRRLLVAMIDAAIAVPKEMSIIGYDDLDFCESLPVSLSTIRQPVAYALETALEILFKRIHDPSAPVRHVTLSTELVVRASTGVPPKPN